MVLRLRSQGILLTCFGGAYGRLEFKPGLLHARQVPINPCSHFPVPEVSFADSASWSDVYRRLL